MEAGKSKENYTQIMSLYETYVVYNFNPQNCMLVVIIMYYFLQLTYLLILNDLSRRNSVYTYTYIGGKWFMCYVLVHVINENKFGLQD